MTYLLTRSYDAPVAIAARRIVKAGAEAGEAAQAASATDALLGLADELGAVKGGRADVHLAGIAPVEAGGVFGAGAWLTADAEGKAVAAAPASPVPASAVVNGADADTDIAIAGIETTDRLGAVIELAADGTAVVDRLAGDKASIASNGNIRTAHSTAGKKLLVQWMRARVPVSAVGRALGAATAAGDLVPVLLAPAAL